jgi:hypothetical protein
VLFSNNYYFGGIFVFKKFVSVLVIVLFGICCVGSVAAGPVNVNVTDFHVGDIINITPFNYGVYGPNFDVVDKAFSKCSLFESQIHIMVYGYDSFKVVKPGVETVEVEDNGYVYTTVFRVLGGLY